MKNEAQRSIQTRLKDVISRGRATPLEVLAEDRLHTAHTENMRLQVTNKELKKKLGNIQYDLDHKNKTMLSEMAKVVSLESALERISNQAFTIENKIDALPTKNKPKMHIKLFKGFVDVVKEETKGFYIPF